MPPNARHERRIVVSTGIVSVYECRAAVAAVAPPPSESVRNGRNPERFAPYPGANAPETDPGMRAVSLLGSDAASVCMRVRSEKRVLPTGMPEGFRRVFSEGRERLPEQLEALALGGCPDSAANPAGNTVLPACGRGSVVRTKGGVFADSSQAIFRASFDRRRFRVRPRPSVQARHGLPILSG